MCKDLSDLSKDLIITFRSSLVFALAANSISLSMPSFFNPTRFREGTSAVLEEYCCISSKPGVNELP